MREIKFRAWDKSKRTMKYPIPYDNGIGVCPDELRGKFCPAELVDINGHKSHISDILMNENLYIPMQYTGLKDKNGKEIYEGDIVKVINWGRKDNLIGIGEIIFNEDEGCWNTSPSLIEDQYDFYTKCNKRAFEIIGNIHENPELLEEINE